MPTDFDTQIQADEFEDPFDIDDEWEWDGDEGDDDAERNYADAHLNYPREVDDDFPMYLEYDGAFGLSGYDEY